MRVSRVGGDVSEESFAVPDEQQRYPVQSFPQASGANLRARAFHLNRQDPTTGEAQVSVALLGDAMKCHLQLIRP